MKGKVFYKWLPALLIFILYPLSGYTMDSRELYRAPIFNIHPSQLEPIFAIGGNYTDLQREDALNELKGKVIDWTIPVYEIKRYKPGIYQILSISNNSPNLIVYLHANNNEKIIHSLRTGDQIRIRGMFTGQSTMRNLIINPAILFSGKNSNNAVKRKPQLNPMEKAISDTIVDMFKF